MSERRIVACAVVGLVVSLLAGCSVPSAFGVLDTEAGPEDKLSADFAEIDASTLDLDSVRFAVSHDGVNLYLAKSPKGDICLAIGSGSSSMIACGDPTGSFGARSPAGSFEVRPAPIAERDGWTVLTENIRVNDLAGSRSG